MQIGWGSVWDWWNSGTAANQASWNGGCFAETSSNKTFSRARPRSQEQQHSCWPWELHGNSQDTSVAVNGCCLLRNCLHSSRYSGGNLVTLCVFHKISLWFALKTHLEISTIVCVCMWTYLRYFTIFNLFYLTFNCRTKPC